MMPRKRFENTQSDELSFANNDESQRSDAPVHPPCQPLKEFNNLKTFRTFILDNVIPIFSKSLITLFFPVAASDNTPPLRCSLIPAADYQFSIINGTLHNDVSPNSESHRSDFLQPDIKRELGVAVTNKKVSAVEDNLEWESWKHDVPFWQHACAGSCAGIVEHCVIHPMDTLKTRVQAGAGLNFHAAIRDVYRTAGFRGFFRGVSTICLASIPAHAALFSVFELCKANLSTDTFMTAAFCGGMSSLCHDLILTPSDVVKQRLQLGCYTGALDCMRTAFHQEGTIAFYRSAFTTVAMNLPHGAVLVATNEALKRFFGLDMRTVNKSQVNVSEGGFPIPGGVGGHLAAHFITAGIAGGVAGVVTNPMDVVKTRLQTQDVWARHREGNPGVASPKYPVCYA